MFGELEITFEAVSASEYNSGYDNDNNNNNANLNGNGDNGLNDTIVVDYSSFRCVDYDNLSRTFSFVAPLETDSPVTRCSGIMTESSFELNHETIYERLDAPAENFSAARISAGPAQCFAPSAFGSVFGTGKPQQPPLIPAVTLNTIFTCDRPLEEIIGTVSSIFDYFGDKMTAQFSPNEFTWYCNYISENQHVNFLVKLYRYSKRHELAGSFAVEFQRIEGDRFPYMNAYNACRDLLTASECDPFAYFHDHDNGCVGFSTVMDCSSQSIPASAMEQEEENLTHIKDSILKQLSVQATYNNLLECIQLLSSLYSSDAEGGSFPSVEKVDTELFLALCDVARRYSSNTHDWVYQHSLIAIADMLCLFDKCGCTGFFSSLKAQKAVVSLLQSMASSNGDNDFVGSKTEQISRMVSLLC